MGVCVSSASSTVTPTACGDNVLFEPGERQWEERLLEILVERMMEAIEADNPLEREAMLEERAR